MKPIVAFSKAKQGINKGKNTFKPTFGSNFSTGDANGAYSNASIDSILGTQLGAIPNRPIMLVFHLTLDANKNLICVQYDLPAKGHSEAKVDYTLAKIAELGMSVWAVKIHTNHKYDFATDITDYATYWTQYKQQCERIADKFVGKGIQYMSISNEFPEVTSSVTHQTDLGNVITSIKSKGYKVGFTFLGMDEADRCLHTDNLDYFGVNMYPSVRNNSQLNTPLFETISTWDVTVSKFKSFRKLYPTKKLIISEVGCTDYLDALGSPAKWDWDPATPNGNGAIAGKFWEGMILALFDNKEIDYIFGWDYQTSFSPYNKQASLDILKKYFIDGGV